MTTPSTETTAARPSRTTAGAALRWLFVGAVGLAAMSLVCAHAPPRFKLLGLFAIVYGLSAGLFLGKVAEALGVYSRRFVLVASLVLIAAGEIGLTLEAFRVYRDTEIEGVLAAGRRLPPAGGGQGASAGALAESARKVAESLLSEQIRLGDYLVHRTRVKHDSPGWPGPWPVVLWWAEVIIGMVAGALFARSLVEAEPR